MRTITLEEHFVTDSFLRATGSFGGDMPAQLAAMRPKLLDLGEERIAAMDASAIDLQVLSLVSMGIDALDAANATAVLHDCNDELAAAVRAHPVRFKGFAALGLKDPAGAAQELERCVSTLGFVGALVDGTTDERFLDDARFLPIFEAAVSLDVPIYLHPAPAPAAVRDAYFSGLPGDAGYLLSIAGWGWHAEMGLHVLRLILSGLFDRLPGLQLIIGHMGEGLPYALARSSAVLSSAAKLKQPVAEYFQSNIHVTTSGYFTVPPLACALDVLGVDRVMFSVDYPFSPNTRGRDYLETLKKSLSQEDLAKLTHGNAERLLKVKADADSSREKQ